MDAVSRDKSTLEYIGVNFASWAEATEFRLAEFETVIMDTRDMAVEPESLHEIRSEIEALLSAGGVVFVLAGPSQPAHVGSNYDFMPSEILQATQLQSSKSIPGKRYVTTDKQWKENYFQWASSYYKTVEGVTQKEKSWILSYWTPTPQPMIAYESVVSENVIRLAVTEITSQVVGCIIHFKGGTIGILPPPDQTLPAVQFLAKIGAELHREQLENLGNESPTPPWLVNHRSSEQRLLDEKVTKMQFELSESEKKLRPIRLIQSCLYSTGVQLERSVKTMFLDFKWEVDDLTKRGEPIDFVIRKVGITGKLQVALTGTSGYVGAESKKFAQLFAAIPFIESDERLVFLVNPLAMDDPSRRMTESCITPEATRRLSNNDVCILFVHDLYGMWIDYKEGKLSSEQIFKSFHQTSGLFDVHKAVK